MLDEPSLYLITILLVNGLVSSKLAIKFVLINKTYIKNMYFPIHIFILSYMLEYYKRHLHKYILPYFLVFYSPMICYFIYWNSSQFSLTKLWLKYQSDFGIIPMLFFIIFLLLGRKNQRTKININTSCIY